MASCPALSPGGASSVTAPGARGHILPPYSALQPHGLQLGFPCVLNNLKKKIKKKSFFKCFCQPSRMEVIALAPGSVADSSSVPEEARLERLAG